MKDLRLFQLHLTEDRVGAPTGQLDGLGAAVLLRRNARSGRCGETPDDCARSRAKLPMVLGPEEVARILEAAPGIKYKAALSAAYGAGLRVSEVVALKVSDIDSKRMMLRVEQGKGRRDRHAMLSPLLLELLRDWWRVARRGAGCSPDRTRSIP